LVSVPNLSDSEYKFGKTRLFLKPGALALLEEHFNRIKDLAAIAIQKQWRREIQRKKFLELKNYTIFVQSAIRSGIGQLEADRRRKYEASIHIQKYIRTYRQVKKLEKAKRAVVLFQSVLRSFYTRKNVQKLILRNATLCIQKHMRMFSPAQYMREARKAALLFQNLRRRNLAQREYSRLAFEERSFVKKNRELEEDKKTIRSKIISIKRCDSIIEIKC